MDRLLFNWLLWFSAWSGGALAFGDNPLWITIIGFIISVGGYFLLIYFEDKLMTQNKSKEYRK